MRLAILSLVALIGAIEAQDAQQPALIVQNPSTRAVILGADGVDNQMADDDVTDVEDDASEAFSYMDMEANPDSAAHRRRRHAFCWRRCVTAAQCHRHKKEFDDDAQQKNNTCMSKVARCDSCMLDCKARYVKCGAEALHLTVEEVRRNAIRSAIAMLCDKCDFRAVMSKCKPKMDEEDPFALTSDDDEEDDDQMQSYKIDDEKNYFFQAVQPDDDSEDDEVYNGQPYDVSEDLDFEWRPRRCEFMVSPKKAAQICSVSSCLVDRAKRSPKCVANAVPVFQFYQKAFDSLLHCRKADDGVEEENGNNNDDDTMLLGQDDGDLYENADDDNMDEDDDTLDTLDLNDDNDENDFQDLLDLLNDDNNDEEEDDDNNDDDDFFILGNEDDQDIYQD